MEFAYVVVFHTDDREIVRTGKGVFFPSDVRAFRLEDMLWQIAQDYDVRPNSVEVYIQFAGEFDGKATPKRIEGPQAT